MRPLFDSICKNIGKVIIGKDETIKLIIKRGEQIDVRTVEARNAALEHEES